MMGSILLCAVAMLCKEQGITVLVSKNLHEPQKTDNKQCISVCDCVKTMKNDC